MKSKHIVLKCAGFAENLIKKLSQDHTYSGGKQSNGDYSTALEDLRDCLYAAVTITFC